MQLDGARADIEHHGADGIAILHQVQLFEQLRVDSQGDGTGWCIGVFDLLKHAPEVAAGRDQLREFVIDKGARRVSVRAVDERKDEVDVVRRQRGGCERRRCRKCRRDRDHGEQQVQDANAGATGRGNVGDYPVDVEHDGVNAGRSDGEGVLDDPVERRRHRERRTGTRGERWHQGCKVRPRLDGLGGRGELLRQRWQRGERWPPLHASDQRFDGLRAIVGNGAADGDLGRALGADHGGCHRREGEGEAGGEVEVAGGKRRGRGAGNSQRAGRESHCTF
ncbi:hypothetical protein EH165_15125 [Nakamurella antarctica]|uniref:Uncharacterized protein n=1 Tax=Nakamurella antarctica TaxID=1902245 RepID=A0A3G9A0F8_9ACTN|nr:hypothetical protein EH165_15125 [Nakamurella antarctica]